MLGLAHTLRRRGPARPRRSSTAALRRLRTLRARTCSATTDGVAKDAEWAERDLRDPGRRPSARPGAAHGGRPHAGHRDLVAAARRARRAAGVGGHRAGRAARPDRPAGRRLRPRLRLDGRRRARRARAGVRCRRFPQGRNPVGTLHPGRPHRRHAAEPRRDVRLRRRARYAYPDIRLVYWAGGNPFHHHQDLNRLRRALARPDTIVVHEPYWTAMARHADIVLPATTHARARRHRRRPQRHATSSPCTRAVAPVRRGAQRLRHLRRARRRGSASATPSPRAATRAAVARAPLRAAGARPGARRRRGAALRRVLGATASVELPDQRRRPRCSTAFRADPDGAPAARRRAAGSSCSPRRSPAFGYDDCPGHPAWLEPDEWLGGDARRQFPLHLIANQPTHAAAQPARRRRVQPGAARSQGREPIRIHPDDAAARGIADGDVVRVFNDRGACLAGAVRHRRACARASSQLSTGAWFDPVDPSPTAPLCVHGNPNVLTPDAGTSRLVAGLHRPARAGGDRAVRRGAAAGHGARAAGVRRPTDALMTSR